MHSHRRQTDRAGEPGASTLGQPQGDDREAGCDRESGLSRAGALLEQQAEREHQHDRGEDANRVRVADRLVQEPALEWVDGVAADMRDQAVSQSRGPAEDHADDDGSRSYGAGEHEEERSGGDVDGAAERVIERALGIGGPARRDRLPDGQGRETYHERELEACWSCVAEDQRDAGRRREERQDRPWPRPREEPAVRQ
jgi:hypothetical protein